MAIQYSQIPKEQFRDLIPTFRNNHIIACMQPLILLHQQIHSNGGLEDRSGTDTAFRNLILMHLWKADRIRRNCTFNQTDPILAGKDLDAIKKAIGLQTADASDVQKILDESTKPVGGDTLVTTTTQLIDVPWQFDGNDTSGTIRLISQLEPRFKAGPGYLLFQSVNEAIVGWTNLESRFRPEFITTYDSLRMYGKYQQILTLCVQFLGEDQRVDVPEAVLGSERPAGPQSAPNILNETSGNQPATNP